MHEDKYRSMDLLWRIKPDVANRLTICYGAIIFASWDLHLISSLEDMEDHLRAKEALRDLGADDSDRYIGYKDLNENWSVFKTAAHWLSEHEVPERIFIFKEAVYLFLRKYRDRILEGNYPITDFTGCLHYIVSDLGIPHKDASEVFLEEYYAYEQLLKMDNEDKMDGIL